MSTNTGNTNVDYPWLRRIKVAFTGMGGGVGDKTFESDGTQNLLRIVAVIEKNVQTASAVSSLMLYNLAPDTRNNFVRSETKVRIEAGWDEGPRSGLSMVFVGHVLTAQSNRAGPEIITTLHIQSGRESVVTTDVFRVWGAGVPLDKVVLEVAEKLPDVKVDPTRVIGLEKKKIGDGGYSVASDAETVLNQLSDEFGFSWTVVDDTFQAINDERAVDSATVLEDPYLISVNPTLAGVQRYEMGVTGRCTFHPGLVPGNYFNVKSVVDSRNNRRYRLTSVVHHLDCFETMSFISDFSGYAPQRG